MIPYFTCSFPYNSDEQESVINAVNVGIDSCLEGFTDSKFYFDGSGRLFCHIANMHEFQILIRRLLEQESETSESLADSMIDVQFGYETV